MYALLFIIICVVSSVNTMTFPLPNACIKLICNVISVSNPYDMGYRYNCINIEFIPSNLNSKIMTTDCCDANKNCIKNHNNMKPSNISCWFKNNCLKSNLTECPFSYSLFEMPVCETPLEITILVCVLVLFSVMMVILIFKCIKTQRQHVTLEDEHDEFQPDEAQ